jgi:DTW domain-containing protein YfiP
MPNLTLLDYGGRGTTWNPITLDDAAQPALLFPDAGNFATPLTYIPLTVVVVDGSWPQARKLVNKLPQLRGMPRMSFQPKGQPQRLRRPPIPDGMSTIEAIARAVEALEDPSKAAMLDDLFARVVANCARHRGRDFIVKPK